MSREICAACGLRKKLEIQCKVCKKNICLSCKGKGACHEKKYGTVKDSMDMHRRSPPPKQKTLTTDEGYPITHEHDGKDRYNF